MRDLRRMETDRLELLATDPDRDAEALFPIFNDPAGWSHAPDHRHLEEQTTADWLRRAARRWDEHRLSYWTVRLGAGGRVIGVGGAQRHVTGSWNLLWRIDAAHRRRGFATELGSAALHAAHAVDGSVPVIAWVGVGNAASRTVAERLGLIEHAERVDGSDGMTRIPYADREI